MVLKNIVCPVQHNIDVVVAEKPISDKQCEQVQKWVLIQAIRARDIHTLVDDIQQWLPTILKNVYLHFETAYYSEMGTFLLKCKIYGYYI